MKQPWTPTFDAQIWIPDCQLLITRPLTVEPSDPGSKSRAVSLSASGSLTPERTIFSTALIAPDAFVLVVAPVCV